MNREETILEAQKLISDGKLEEARSMIEAIKEEDSKQELEVKEEKKEIFLIESVDICCAKIGFCRIKVIFNYY